MTIDPKLKIAFGILSIGLLTILLIKLAKIPGGMILPGWFLGGMLLVGALVICLLLSGILRLFIKKLSYLTLLFIVTTITLTYLHYYFYSPKLTIVVPNGYCGEVNLVKANTNRNILTLDNNGIGYLTKWTFNKTYLKPTVIQENGKNLEKNLVGFNPSTFFGTSKSCCINGQQFESISFEIVPDSLIGQKQYYSKDLVPFVDKKLVLFSKHNKYTTFDSITTEVNNTK